MLLVKNIIKSIWSGNTPDRPCSLRSSRISPCAAPRRRKKRFPFKAHDVRSPVSRLDCRLGYTIIPGASDIDSLGAFPFSTNLESSLFCQPWFHGIKRSAPALAKAKAHSPNPPRQLKAGYTAHSCEPHCRFNPIR